jgi:hypothetical protein
MADVSLDQVFVRSERIVGRPVAEEYVLVPIARQAAELDSIFSLNRVAAFIWQRVDGRAAGRDIATAVVEQFDVDRGTAEQDVAAFLARLASVGAVRAVSPDED